MKRNVKYSLLAAGVLTTLGVAFVSGRVSAGGIPVPGALAYAGVLLDSTGAPLSGTSHTIEIKLWSAPSGGSALCDTGTPTAATPLDGGRFSIALPDACSTAIGANSNAYVEVVLDGSSLGRSKLGAV